MVDITIVHGLSWFISGLTLVYGRYNYSSWGLEWFINQLITRGPHPAAFFHFLSQWSFFFHSKLLVYWRVPSGYLT